MTLKVYQILALNAVFAKFSYTKASATLVLQMMKNKVVLENEIEKINQVKSHLAESCRPGISKDSPAYNDLWDKNFEPLQIKLLEETREIELQKISEKDLDTLIRPVLANITSADLATMSLITNLS
jgi:hypothetical protein